MNKPNAFTRVGNVTGHLPTWRNGLQGKPRSKRQMRRGTEKLAGGIVKVTERHRDNARDIATARKAATAANVEVFELVNVMQTSAGGRQDDLPVVPAAEDGGASAAIDAGGAEEAGVDTTAPPLYVPTDASPSMGEINQPDTLRHMDEVPPPIEGLP